MLEMQFAHSFNLEDALWETRLYHHHLQQC